MMPNTDVLHDLEPTVERLLERHLASSKEWFPHEYVPYSRGRDHVTGEIWSEDDADLAGAKIDDAVRSALLVNLLTEDNLPYYFRSVERMFGADGPWGTWVRRWTAEEGRHAMAIYGYLMVTRAIDPHQSSGAAWRRSRPASRPIRPPCSTGSSTSPSRSSPPASPTGRRGG